MKAIEVLQSSTVYTIPILATHFFSAWPCLHSIIVAADFLKSHYGITRMITDVEVGSISEIRDNPWLDLIIIGCSTLIFHLLFSASPAWRLLAATKADRHLSERFVSSFLK